MDLDLGSGKNLDRFGGPYLSNGPFTSKIMQNDAKRTDLHKDILL